MISSGGLRTKGITKQTQENRPLITIITVVRNGEKSLEETILSVINQTYTNIEYIVIDGASTDGTLDIIKKYEDRIDYWMSEPDEGIYDAMNKGVKQASGELIGLVNSDDRYELSTVEHVVKKYLEKKLIGIYYGDMRFIKNGKSKIIKNKDIKFLKNGMVINHPACFVHNLVYKDIGCFNAGYKIAADYDFLLRAYLASVPFIYIHKILCNMSYGGVSTINYLDGWKEEKSVLVKNGYGFLHAEYNYHLKIIKRKIRDIQYKIFG